VLGTAHISRSSADKVRELLLSGEFDAVAVELGTGRYKRITEPESVYNLDLFHIVKSGMASMAFANLALSAFQQRMAEQLGVEPGEEFRAAIEVAENAGYPVLLIDREIGVTLKRIYRNVSIWHRMRIITSLLMSLVSRQKISEEEIERLKEGDVLESTFTQFARKERDLYEPLIDERDRYMAIRLIQEARKTEHHHIIAIVGAGHLQGIRNYLKQSMDQSGLHLDQELSELNRVPPPEKWLKLVPWMVTALVLTGFFIGFSRSTTLGWQLIRDWVFINGGLSSLGALVALAHPLTIAGAFVAAPITSLNPMIGAGMVTAAIEIWLRKPNIGDFNRLRHETTYLKGWWRNRVTRILLIFLFSSLGSAIGTYLAGFRIFNKLT